MKLKHLLVGLTLCVSAVADTSNTQTGDLNTNQQAGGDISTNEGTVINQTSQSGPRKAVPPSAIAPSYMSSGNDTCLIGKSVGAQTSVIGFSSGGYERDLVCERLKLSKVLYDQGMKIGALTILCSDLRVFQAMHQAGTPCPINVKGRTYIGKMAYVFWERYPERRPDYDFELHGPPSWEREAEKVLEDDEESDTRSLSERFRTSKR